MENEELDDVFDWGHSRPPLQTLSETPGSLLERAVYFGWVWEPNDSVNVMVVTWSNDADVDLSLWNIGGERWPRYGEG